DGLGAVSLHLSLALLLVVGWLLDRLATPEHPFEPAPEPARSERFVDSAVRLGLSGLVVLVVRCFGPDHCSHAFHPFTAVRGLLVSRWRSGAPPRRSTRRCRSTRPRCGRPSVRAAHG